MKQQIINLDPHDDANSVRDRLRWIRADQVVLVFPDTQETNIHSRLELLLILREAARQGAELGVVTKNPHILEGARELNVPCYPTIDKTRLGHSQPRRNQTATAAASMPHSHRSRIQGEERTLRGLALVLRQAQQGRPHHVVWIAYILLAVFTAALLIPGAEVEVHPITNQTNILLPVTADPDATTIDLVNAIIPARKIGIEVEATATTDTTGSINVPTDKARGTVVLTNLIPDQITVPAGTIVRSSAAKPIRFMTLADATLPGRIGGSIEVGVEALAPGYEGNLPSNKVNEIEGILAARVAVTNPSPFRGGDALPVQSVSQQDYERVKALVVQQLQQRAYAEMRSDSRIGLLDTEFVLIESLGVVLVDSESYSASVGERAASITLSMQATVQGIAIDDRNARQFVYAKMVEKNGTNMKVKPDSLSFKHGPVVNIGDRHQITFIMSGAADVIPAIDAEQLRRKLAAKDAADARYQLQQDIPLTDTPMIQIWPPFWPFMPLLPVRITIKGL